MFDLSGRKALVCGSTQGIGRACADALAEQGAGLTLAARNEEALGRVCGEIKAATGCDADYICADFSEPDAVRDAVAAYALEHGPIHILVNNTGGPKSGPIFEAQPEDFVRAIRMHVVCNQLLVQTLAPGMKQAGYGRIINIVSTSVREPIAGLGVSNTTRAAVAGWAKTLSKELGPFGVTVNNVLPGFTATARLDDLMHARAKRENATFEEVRERFRTAVPMGRFAKPTEIAAVVAFLASPAASYVSGVSLPVDGARLASI